MAIEKDLGSGGLPEDINVPSPELEQAEIDVIEFDKSGKIKAIRAYKGN